MKKAVAFTWVKDYRQMAEDCAKSFNHFHPDVEFRIFDWEHCQRIMKEVHCTSQFLFAPLARELLEEFDVAVHVDSDILVTAPLTRALQGSFDVAGVRALPDEGLPDKSTFRRMNRINGEYIRTDSELNAGFFAVTSKRFVDEWIASNARYGMKMPLVEQDTLNDLFWSGRFDTLLLDPTDFCEFWGTGTKFGSCLGAKDEEGFLESWKGLRLEGAEIRLRNAQGKDKLVRMLHMAGGQWKDKELGFDAPYVKSVFAPEVWARLIELRGRP